MYRIRIAFAGASGLACALLLGSALAADAGLVTQIEGLLKQLGGTPETTQLTAQAKAGALASLEKAKQATAAGDTASATLLNETALEWAQLGGDVIVTSRQERAALETERALLETTNQVRRAEAFLEETEARRGRALAQLERPSETPDSALLPATAPASTGTLKQKQKAE